MSKFKYLTTIEFGEQLLAPKPVMLGAIARGGKSGQAVPYEQAVKYEKDGTTSGVLSLSDTTESTGTTVGALKTAGGLAVVKNAQIGGVLVTSKAVIQKHTAVAINTTAAGTLAVVASGLVAGYITSTSAAAVTITLDSVAAIVTAFAAVGVGVTLAAGSIIEFWVDNSGGANTVTVAVDVGATIAVTTPAITGGATLTVSTANAVAKFALVLTSATTAKLLRLY